MPKKKQSNLLESIESQAAFARVELGMSRSEFDQLTPAQFAEHYQFWKRKVYREDYNIALIRHTVAAAGGLKHQNGDPLSFQFFEPKHPDTKRRKSRVRRQTNEEAHRAFLSGISPSRIVAAEPNGQ